jgi:hypothetical protein
VPLISATCTLRDGAWDQFTIVRKGGWLGRTAVTVWFQVWHKHLCGEKSVDLEKPENSGGTTVEQLFPNKAILARILRRHPP